MSPSSIGLYVARDFLERWLERDRPTPRIPKALLPPAPPRPGLERALETGRLVAARRRWSSAAIEPRPSWRKSYGP